jgi:arginyl-tRNA synthetase
VRGILSTAKAQRFVEKSLNRRIGGMIQAKKQLQDAANHAVEALVRACEPDESKAALALGIACPVPFESPKQASHGDLAITVAMQLAKPLRSNPRAVAEQLVARLREQPVFARWVSALEIAGPGFINLRLSDAAKQAVIGEVLSAADRFGCQPANGEKLMVEFVSANPTGPLHVGHARQGALGDSLCHLFATQGFEVTREFYYNDAGVQIATLAA